VLVEDTAHIHYAKGALAMYALADAIGEDRVNAVSAKATPRGGGGLDVHLTGKVKKVHADELGREEEVPVDDELPVGVLGRDNKVLFEQRIHVKGEDFDVVLAVPDGAEKAAIDPSSEMIDRRPEDNLIAIEK